MRSAANQLGLILLLAASARAWQNEQFCVARAQNNTCTQCVYSTASGPDCISLKTVIPGCYYYNSDGSCSMCQDGYYQNLNTTSANVCTPLNATVTNFCTVSYISPDTCSICKNGVMAMDGICQDDIPCFDPNCDQCGLDTTTRKSICWYCRPNYILFYSGDASLCIPAPKGLEGCYSSSSLYRCDNCNVGFAAKDGKCFESSDTRFKSASRMAAWGALMTVAAFWLRV